MKQDRAENAEQKVSNWPEFVEEAAAVKRPGSAEP